MNIYIVYHSNTGLTHGLAKSIAAGVESKKGAHAFLRRIPDYHEEATVEKLAHEKGVNKFPIPENGRHQDFLNEYNKTQTYSVEELKSADGLIVGSPVYFGAMSAATKIFIESLAPLWVENKLVDRACGAFACSGTLHGGVEQTLQSIISSLLTYSMIPVGLPFRTAYMRAHGSVFGPVATLDLTPESKSLAELFGARVAEISHALTYHREGK